MARSTAKQLSTQHSALSTDRPIGIFDSGVGGLTVFREVARALPHQPLIYLGDSARVPYGTKSPQTVVRYSLEAANHLLGRGIGMLVVACNTATAAARGPGGARRARGGGGGGRRRARGRARAGGARGAAGRPARPPPGPAAVA